jgi:hypothetical protein
VYKPIDNVTGWDSPCQNPLELRFFSSFWENNNKKKRREKNKWIIEKISI